MATTRSALHVNPGPEGLTSIAIASSVLMLVRLGAALLPAFEAPRSRATSRGLGR